MANEPSYHEGTCVLKQVWLRISTLPLLSSPWKYIHHPSLLSCALLDRVLGKLQSSKQVSLLTLEYLQCIANRCCSFSERQNLPIGTVGCTGLLSSREAVDRCYAWRGCYHSRKGFVDSKSQERPELNKMFDDAGLFKLVCPTISQGRDLPPCDVSESMWNLLEFVLQ